MIAEWLLARAAGLFSLAKRSVLLSRFEKREESPPPLKREGRLFRLRRRVLSLWETSGLARLARWMPLRAQQCRVGSVGLFLVSNAAVLLCGVWLTASQKNSVSGFWCATVALVSALPLLGDRRTVGRAIREDRLAGALCFHVCGFSDTEPPAEKSGNRGSAGLFGALTGLVAVILPMPWLPMIGLLPWGILTVASAPSAVWSFLAMLAPFLSLSAHPTGLLLLLLGAVGMLHIGKLLMGKRQMVFRRADGLVLCLAALWLLGGVSGAVTGFLLIAAWFPVRLFLSDGNARRRLLTGLSLGALIVSCLGIWQYVMGKAPLAWVDLSRFGGIGGRVCAVFQNPNILAVYLLLTLPLGLWRGLSAKTWGGRLMGWLCFLSEGLCMVLTWSRGGWLGWGISTLLFLSCYSPAGLSSVLILPLPAVALFHFLPSSLTDRFGSILSLGETSIRYRLNTWRGVTRLLSHHPFGIGCGDAVFHRFFPLYAVSGTESVMHAHQIWLQTAVELGLTGAFLLMALLICLLRRWVSLCRSAADREVRGRALAVVSALAGVLTMGLFDHVWYCKPLFWMFWLLCAVLMNEIEEGETWREADA
ncbi:MAG: hypothetical protein E7620_05610 [Ruminococcaceae bacterium]|nr:hypothetical protein [Oscillospiraceae bacterium]